MYTSILVVPGVIELGCTYIHLHRFARNQSIRSKPRCPRLLLRVVGGESPSQTGNCSIYCSINLLFLSSIIPSQAPNRSNYSAVLDIFDLPS